MEYQKENKIKDVSGVTVRLGELQQIDMEIFEFSLKEIAGLEKMKLDIKIETEKALLRCMVCGNEWDISGAPKGIGEDEAEFIHFVPDVAHVYLRCPGCKSPDFEILRGRGVRVESIRGVK